MIALTAYGGEHARDVALNTGLDRHLSKPIDPAELVRTIIDSRARKFGSVG
ncbi:MAG TPA: hypothetical protein VGM62_16490 [Chthoniobacterales bacterium]